MSVPASMSAMHVPDLDPGGARETAERLRRVSRLGGQALSRLEGAAPTGWSGSASEAYYEQRGRAAERCDLLQDFARSVSTGLDRYADAVEPALRGMRECAAELENALVRKAAGAADVVADAAASALVERAWSGYESHRRRYDLAVQDLTDLLAQAPDFVGRPIGAWDHVDGAGRTFVQRAVVEPATGVAALVGQVWSAPASSGQLAQDLVTGWLEQLRHPVEPAKDAVGWQHWEKGEYGSAVGAGAALFMGRKGPGGARPDTHRGWAEPLGKIGAPKPRVQTVDEMLAGVDLVAHEHHTLGHTLVRHVDVDDAYLVDRLENGTLEADGSRGRRPPIASRWHDLDTAEREITAVLQRHEEQVRAFAAGETKSLPPLKATASAPVGKAMWPANGRYVTAESAEVVVILGRKDGQVCIVSAYLDEPKS